MNDGFEVQVEGIVHYLIGGLIVAPVVGGLVGFFVAMAFAWVVPLHSGGTREFDYILLFGVTCGPVFGAPLGLLLGLLTAWPLRNLPPLRTIVILSGCTLAGALPFCGAGPLSIIPALMGYTAGYIFLMGKRHHPAG